MLLLALAGIPVIGGYVAYSLAMVERTLPTKTPASVGLSYEEVTFPSREDGVALSGWFMPALAGESARSVILLHGQHGNKGDEYLGFLPLARALAERGYNVLTFDLRGHGQSEGSHRSFGYYERRDLSGAVDYLESRGAAGEWVGVIGFSMGAGTALLTAAEDERLAAVVADSAYADIRELVERELPSASRLPEYFTPVTLTMARLLLGIDLDQAAPEKVVARLAPRPLLLIHGTEDATVPLAHAERLAAAYPRASLWAVPGVGHVGAYLAQPEEYLRRVEQVFAGS